jgi:hypothetical protein
MWTRSLEPDFMTRKIAGALVALACGLLGATPAAAQLANGPYKITNKNSAKCVDAANAGTANGTIVQQFTCNATNAQVWQLVATDSGYYKILSQNNTAQGWDVNAAGTTDGTKIQLWANASATNQQFQTVAETGGYYHLVARHDGKCVDVAGSSTADSVQLQQWSCNGTAAQAFQITSANGATPTSTAGPTPTVQPLTIVNLSSAANVNAHYSDGTTFPATGGLDGVGSAYSSTLLGTSLTWSSTTFNFVAANALNGVRNKTITLPAGTFGSLLMLGTAVNGDQLSQTVKVNYSDGTSSTFTQTFSNWLNASQAVAGQSIAKQMAYRNKSTGVKDNRVFNLYGYSFALTSGKTVSSLVLPANNNVAVLAVTLRPGNPPPTATAVATATRTSTPTATATKAPTATPTPGTASCGSVGGVNYVEAYRSSLTRWCINQNEWNAHASSFQGYFAYGDNVITNLGSLFGYTPAGAPFTIEATQPTGGACACQDFGGLGVNVTGDAFYGGYTAPITGTSIPGFWGYLLTLHEFINVWTGTMTPNWPTDWWADHRSPFPNEMDYRVMQSIGNSQNNQTLKNAATAQFNRFQNTASGEYDSEVVMFEGFFASYGGYAGYNRGFGMIRGDGINWSNVSPNPSEKLSEYVIAYFSMGFQTTTDITSKFSSAGVGTKDTTIAAYSVNPAVVGDIATARCSIQAGAAQGLSTTTAMSNLRSGNYSAANMNTTCTGCPTGICGCDSVANRCVAPWRAR